MDEIDHLLSSLADHIEAGTEKAPADRESEELEEAHSIAENLTDESHDREAVQERVGTVLELLEDVEDDGTGNDEADEHVEAAKRAAERIRNR